MNFKYFQALQGPVQTLIVFKSLVNPNQGITPDSLHIKRILIHKQIDHLYASRCLPVDCSRWSSSPRSMEYPLRPGIPSTSNAHLILSGWRPNAGRWLMYTRCQIYILIENEIVCKLINDYIALLIWSIMNSLKWLYCNWFHQWIDIITD